MRTEFCSYLVSFKRVVGSWWYGICVALLHPANWIMHRIYRDRAEPRSVLHLSGMVHVPWQITRLLRKRGWRADYLALGRSPIWEQADYCRMPKTALWDAFDEFAWFWGVAARYEILHLHFMTTLSRSGWELAWAKRMGRSVVVHWRGCENRDREKNMALHPDVNMCETCDYHPRACELPINGLRRRLAARYGDRFLVTTPDMLDFAPQAMHLPFLSPEEPPATRPARGDAPLRLVHVTVHPGLEGTAEIKATVERLRSKGRRIEFVALSWLTRRQVLEAFAGADLAIGKMKMGYYANAQIESMAMGVPTITYVRPEFITEELRRSGFIFSTLKDLEYTLEYYLDHPEALEAKRAMARESIMRLHDNETVIGRLVAVYDGLTK